ncbi:MAG TPA: hypothetical protein VIL92_13725 [Gaiellaceae bacterium]|jgi:hypothetical protein
MKRTRVERGIYRQQNGTYGVYLLVDGKPRYKTVGSKLAEARLQRDLLSAKAQRGELPEPTRLTFAQLAETWIANFETLVAAGDRAERTLENCRYHVNKAPAPRVGPQAIARHHD